MLGFRYLKAPPTAYVMQYRNGSPVREGAGLAFWYFAPNTSLVSIPMASTEVPFMFRELSQDFQEVSVQGYVTYRVAEPQRLAQLMNFTLRADGNYESEDPTKLPQRVAGTVQVLLRLALQQRTLHDAVGQADALVSAVRGQLRDAPALRALGIEVIDFALMAVKPSPEATRALEAPAREAILRQADDAIYVRRNAAIEQERAIKENELDTDIAVEAKKRAVREAQLDAERAVLARRLTIQDEEMAGQVRREEANQTLTDLKTANAKKEADAQSYALNEVLKAVGSVDPKVWEALAVGQLDAGRLIAHAFRGLAANAGRIGELNISPDLLQQLSRGTSKG